MRSISAILILVLFPMLAVAKEAPPIPLVKTLDDLRNSPVHTTADGHKVRIGISEENSILGPWRVIYCLAEGDATETAVKERRGSGEPLGPVFVDVLEEPRARGMRSLPQVVVSRQQPLLFARAIPTLDPGRFVVRVTASDEQLLGEHRLVIDEEEPWYWQSFAHYRYQEQGPDWIVSERALAKYPDFLTTSVDGLADEQPLPLLAADDAAALRLMIEGKVLHITAEEPFVTRPDLSFLARWWVNDQPVPAVRLEQPGARASTGLVDMTEELHIQYAIPEHLGPVKAGDVVSLQVLYAPGAELLPPKGQAMLMQLLLSSSGSALRLSNRLDITLTDELLE